MQHTEPIVDDHRTSCYDPLSAYPRNQDVVYQQTVQIVEIIQFVVDCLVLLRPILPFVNGLQKCEETGGHIYIRYSIPTNPYRY